MSDFATEYLRNSVKLPNHGAMSALDKDIAMFSLCHCFIPPKSITTGANLQSLSMARGSPSRDSRDLEHNHCN
jgi:hypothetical protein